MIGQIILKFKGNNLKIMKEKKDNRIIIITIQRNGIIIKKKYTKKDNLLVAVVIVVVVQYKRSFLSGQVKNTKQIIKISKIIITKKIRNQ